MYTISHNVFELCLLPLDAVVFYSVVHDYILWNKDYCKAEVG